MQRRQEAAERRKEEAARKALDSAMEKALRGLVYAENIIIKASQPGRRRGKKRVAVYEGAHRVEICMNRH